MKQSLAVELPISSALSCVYVSGVQVDVQQSQGSYKRSSVAKNSYYTSGAPSKSAERALARAALAALTLPEATGKDGSSSGSGGGHRSSEKDAHHSSMWDRISGMPLSKPMRMEGGQPVAAGGRKDDFAEEEGPLPPEEEARRNRPRGRGKMDGNQLFSEYTAKPYYTGSHVLANSTTNAASTGAATTMSSTTSSGGRTPLIFIHEDYLITSTSQYLQIWDGFPTGPAAMVEQKKIRHSYSVMKWCTALQRLFCGDVQGTVRARLLRVWVGRC